MTSWAGRQMIANGKNVPDTSREMSGGRGSGDVAA